MADPGLEHDDDPLAAFAAGQRRRRLIGLGVVSLVALVVAGGWAWWRATGLPPIDDEAASDVSAAMDSLGVIAQQDHAQLAAAAMVELERGRLPPPMVQAFEDALAEDALAVPPDMINVVVLAPFAEDADSLAAWTVACPAGADALASVAATGDIDALFATCQLGRWSLIDGHAARRVSAGRLVLAHAAWGWLVDHHAETELERRVLRVFVQG